MRDSIGIAPLILAVIPARSGSKRIPGKNVRLFCGKPIIQYSIDAALDSGVFDRVIVSTDSEEIATVAKRLGAEAPFTRPAELSDDHTPTIPVVRHAIESLESRQDSIELACCIYATAPFIDAADIRKCLKMLRTDKSASFAFPITTFPFPIFRSLKLDGERVGMFFPEHEMTRSQDLPEAYHDAGQFYWGTLAGWSGTSGILSSRSVGYPIPRYNVQDIDTPEDWARAELMFQSRQSLQT